MSPKRPEPSASQSPSPSQSKSQSRSAAPSPPPSLAAKLRIKPGSRLTLRHAPDAWRIPGLPADTAVTTALAEADIVLAFFRDAAALRTEAPVLASELADGAWLWTAWPRKAAGHVSDLDEHLLREVLLPHGLVDVKVAMLDEDWSGLAFTRRKELRAKG